MVPPTTVPGWVAPPYVRLHETACTLAVPVLIMLTAQCAGLAVVQDTTLPVTRALLVNDPKRPKTNPAIAMAAMSVIAIKITVAKTGEIAFLALRGLVILKLCLALLGLPGSGERYCS